MGENPTKRDDSSATTSPVVLDGSKMKPEEKLKVLMEEAEKFNALPPEEQDLARRKLFNAQMKAIGEIWDSFSRKKRRALTAGNMKYSQRVKRRLK